MRVVWYVCVVGVSLFKDYINQHPQCGDPSSVSYSHCVKLAKLYSVQYFKVLEFDCGFEYRVPNDGITLI